MNMHYTLAHVHLFSSKLNPYRNSLDNQTPLSTLFQPVEVHEQSLGWWEPGGGFPTLPPPAEEITPCNGSHKLQQGRMVRARESTADNRLPSTALTATSCFDSQPNPPTVPLCTAERLPSFSRLNMHPVSRLSFPVLSLHFSHISHFSQRFPPSLLPLLRSPPGLSRICVVHLSLPRLLTLHHPLTGMGLSRCSITLPQLPQTVHSQCFSYLRF